MKSDRIQLQKSAWVFLEFKIILIWLLLLFAFIAIMIWKSSDGFWWLVIVLLFLAVCSFLIILFQCIALFIKINMYANTDIDWCNQYSSMKKYIWNNIINICFLWALFWFAFYNFDSIGDIKYAEPTQTLALLVVLFLHICNTVLEFPKTYSRKFNISIFLIVCVFVALFVIWYIH